MQHIFVGDDTSIAYYDLELRETLREYCHNNSPYVKVWSEKSCHKLMLTVFWIVKVLFVVNL